MREFIIDLEDRPGALADILEILHRGNVNLKAISGSGRGSRGIVKFISNDEELARNCLKVADLDFREHEVVKIKIMDKPGELARVTRSIADLGINIRSIYLTERTNGVSELILNVDNLMEVKNMFQY